MQQRQLRLGDILDDYCPRERRITNHAVVAIVGQEVRQTRCVTCEAEHEYKQARVPPQRRKKPVSGALYQEVLEGMPRRPAPAHAALAADEDESLPALETAMVDDEPEEEEHESDGAVPEESEGPVHRPLIRATLPRPEGQAPARPTPEFTVRQPNARPGRFKPGGPPRRGTGQQTAGPSHGFNGRRGPGPASSGRPGHGNRVRPAHVDRQGGQRRRGGKKRMK